MSAGITLGSNGMTLESWRIGKDNAQPQVYVTVIELFINCLMLYGVAQGVMIKFWHHLLCGTTVRFPLS
jgi:hypothetical protein